MLNIIATNDAIAKLKNSWKIFTYLELFKYKQKTLKYIKKRLGANFGRLCNGTT